MDKYFLAVDIGASSGRHILGKISDGRLELEEIYRFQNGLHDKNGSLCWDVPQLFSEIKAGMKKCADLGKIPCSMGIDTWGVDFVPVDDEGNIVGDTVGYRDSRTNGADDEVYKLVDESALYARTGIQKQIFNTVYQLMALKQKSPEVLERAQKILLMPDYFGWLLTGNSAAEYTNATTTQLINPETMDWDFELIDTLGYPRRIFQPVTMPGTVLGRLTEEIATEVGFSCEVILPATHDTGSAVLAVPADGALYISSGTWSLIGVERESADCSEKSASANFTNEGGFQGRYRYLKNIMGLWMIQSVRNEAGGEAFSEIERKTRELGDFGIRIDVNDDRFLSPVNMTEAVRDYCSSRGFKIPQTEYEVFSIIYHSLAECYAGAVSDIEALTGEKYAEISIVGGGCKDGYLNELTAAATGRHVFAGPVEATAIGNLLAQMIGAGEFESVKAARELVKNSFEIKIFGN